MSDYYRDLNENEKIIHWLETIVGRLDVMNNNLISILKYQQQGLSVVKGTTIVYCDGGVSFEISECMEDREGYIHHVHWCKGECNL
jgi:hypothetical protein